MAGRIRPATLDDVSSLVAIYTPAVLNTPITWEYEIPSHEDFSSRVKKVFAGGHPYLVLENRDGEIVGYAYAGTFRDRIGYRFCCESSIYLRSDAQGQGLGKLLYSRMLEILRRQGFVSVIGGLTYPNPASEALHRSLGFELIGVFPQIGYKFNMWHSACFMQKELNPREAPIGESPTSFFELLAAGKLSDLLGDIAESSHRGFSHG